MATHALMTKVRRTLESSFPGAEVDLERATPASKIGGTLVWDGFVRKDQIDRQRAVREALRTGLDPDEQQRLSAILTLTPAEIQVMKAG